MHQAIAKLNDCIISSSLLDWKNVNTCTNSNLQLTVKYPVFEGDSTVPTVLFTVQVYNPSSVLLRLVMVKVEVARLSALGLVIVVLASFVMISEPFCFHITFATGFPSYSQLRVTL